MKTKLNIFSVIHLLIFICALTTDWYRPLAIILFISIILLMLDKLGKGIVLREVIALHTTFVCVLVPVLGFAVFNRSDRIARIFLKYMMVPENVYFGFALPAIAGFVLVLCWPMNNGKYSDSGLYLREAIARAKEALQKRPTIGVYLLAIGTVMFWVSKVLPSEVQFAFLLFFFAGFAGFLYIYFLENFRWRRILLFFFGAFIILTALSSGMFTIVAYMSLTLFSFFFLGRKTSLFKKLLMFLAGVFILLLIQSVKPAYRQLTWNDNFEGNKALLFVNLLGNQLTDPKWESTDAFFPVYLRVNQGYNISLVMRRFPEKMPYDGGKNLFISLVSSFVPRIFWPDKPEAGGKYNMRYYAGLNISGWSTNVGPLGEAYGSFGPVGGMIFMILLGLLIRWAYCLVFKKSVRWPLLIFWIPVLFYQVTYAAETDSLQIFNSLTKAAFFIWLLLRQWPQWFGVEKKRPGVVIMPEKEFEAIHPLS
ncbi:MAG TPA: hypothetical protein VN616_05730 [Puia sp.]|nr:hypothetical protein [Puia sp.]